MKEQEIELKQVIIVARNKGLATKVIYDADQQCISGDEDKVKKLLRGGASLCLVVRGTKGESLKADMNPDGQITGNPLVAKMLEGFVAETEAYIKERDSGDAGKSAADKPNLPGVTPSGDDAPDDADATTTQPLGPSRL